MSFDAGAEEYGANGSVGPYKAADVGITIGFGALNSLAVGQLNFKKNEIKLYPVPSNGVLNLMKSNTIIGDVKIYDALGNLLYTDKINTNTAKIDISHFSSGVYLLKTNKAFSRFVIAQKS